MQILITDPCYVIPQEEWPDFLDATDFGEENFPYKSKESNVVVHHCEPTRYGDGSLTGSGWKIGVDSGLLCVAEIEHWDGKFGKPYDDLSFALLDFDDVMAEYNGDNDDFYEDEDEDEDDF